jgi:hypothetical protein
MTTNDATNNTPTAPKSLKGYVTAGARDFPMTLLGENRTTCLNIPKDTSVVFVGRSFDDLHVRDDVLIDFPRWAGRKRLTITKIAGYDADGNVVPNVSGRPAPAAVKAEVVLATDPLKRLRVIVAR